MQHPSEISILDYTYELPPEKIAIIPNDERDGAKLLVYKTGSVEETKFSQISNFLPANSLLVFNNTKVVAARLNFETQSGYKVEVFCLGSANNGIDPATAMLSKGNVRWKCFVGNLKRWEEKILVLENEGIKLSIEIVERKQDELILDFYWTPADLSFIEIIEKIGQIPIPPYLKRVSTEVDAIRYQTVYAQSKGSVAAPTAGLHFTENVLNELSSKNIKSVYLTLHVGAGTFKPVKSDKMLHHNMHAEWMHISRKDIETIKNNLNAELICVGTTSLRALESLYWMGLKIFYTQDIIPEELMIKQWDVYNLKLKEIKVEKSLEALLFWMNKNNIENLNCETQILIAPPYKLKIAKGLITNFHQPRSTLLLLVAAVIGGNWREVYNFALNNNFKFLSYGDSSLLLNPDYGLELRSESQKPNKI